MIPKYTWQYMDDPAGQRQMQQKNAFDAKFKMKPCPVRAPVKAEEFLRRDLIEKYRNSEESVAEGMLQAQSAMPLTDNQALELAGELLVRPNTKARPFLIRAVDSHVGTAGFEIHANKNGDVSAIGGALSHHDIPPERRPIVVWLETPPHEIYLWFDVTE